MITWGPFCIAARVRAKAIAGVTPIPATTIRIGVVALRSATKLPMAGVICRLA